MGRVLASHARATIVTVGAAAAFLLAGCSDGAGAQPGPSSGGPPLSSTTSTSTASTPPTTTSSPSGTSSVAVPAAARAHTDEGAKAFARFYTEAMDRATVSADSAPLRALTDPNCAACAGIVEVVDGYRSRGEHQERTSIVLGASKVVSSSPKGVEVDVLAEDKPHRVVRRDGSVVSTSPGAKINFRHTVSWVATGWLVTDSEIVQ